MAKERSSSSLLERFAGGRKAVSARAAPPLFDTAAAASVAPRLAPARTQGELPGTELAAMADKQEGILERVMQAQGHTDPEEAKGDLAALHGVLVGLSQKTLLVVFAMGKLLSEVKYLLPHGDFIPWVESNCAFTERAAQRYMRVYERYRDEPRKALAELSLTEAYVEAGVKKISAPEIEENPVHPKGTPNYDVDTWKDWKSVFKNEPISGVTLKHHRIVPYHDGKLYVVREETGPVLACNLLADLSISDEGYQDALQEAHHNLQMTLEVFYSKLEVLEDQGILSKPFDSSRAAMAKRMRNVSPHEADRLAQTKALPAPAGTPGTKKQAAATTGKAATAKASKGGKR